MRKKLAISNPLSSHGIFRELLDILLFMIITYGLHYLWWNFLWDYKEVLYINEAAGILAQGVFHCASFILDIVGVAHRAIDNTLYFDNSSIKVTITCSGLKQMYISEYKEFLDSEVKNKKYFFPGDPLQWARVNEKIFHWPCMAYLALDNSEICGFFIFNKVNKRLVSLPHASYS